ncbi:GtrA family protein [Cytobacillus sp. Hz8]|uniref:GtrA family protein n=1 Tax=Cytobacillus sp. Hz8 TaxID=3347168 RepID=UPI0035D72E91
MISKTYLKQTKTFIRFLIVGVINTMIGLSVMLITVHWFDFSYWLATFTGNSIGACVSFFLNRSFTFQSTVGWGQSVWKFLLVILSCYFLSYSFSDICSKVVGDLFSLQTENEKDLAILLGTGFYMISNYLGQKNFVFRRKITAL